MCACSSSPPTKSLLPINSFKTIFAHSHGVSLKANPTNGVTCNITLLVRVLPVLGIFACALTTVETFALRTRASMAMSTMLILSSSFLLFPLRIAGPPPCLPLGASSFVHLSELLLFPGVLRKRHRHRGRCKQQMQARPTVALSY